MCLEVTIGFQIGNAILTFVYFSEFKASGKQVWLFDMKVVFAANLAILTYRILVAVIIVSLFQDAVGISIR